MSAPGGGDGLSGIAAGRLDRLFVLPIVYSAKRLSRQFVQAGIAGRQQRREFFPHARRPEASEMIFYSCDGIFAPLRAEEVPDVIGHSRQMLVRAHDVSVCAGRPPLNIGRRL